MLTKTDLKNFSIKRIVLENSKSNIKPSSPERKRKGISITSDCNTTITSIF